MTADASSCSILSSVEGREYADNDSHALEQNWGDGAVSALRQPLPSPSHSRPSEPNDTAAATAEKMEETGGEGGAAVVGGATDGELVLLLACLCRGLGTTFVVRVPEILGRWVVLWTCGKVVVYDTQVAGGYTRSW